MPSGGLGNFFFHSKKENSSEKVYRMQCTLSLFHPMYK